MKLLITTITGTIAQDLPERKAIQKNNLSKGATLVETFALKML